MRNQRIFKGLVKTVAIITVISFIWQDFTMANGGSPAWKQVTPIESKSQREPVSRIEVSPDIALLQTSHQGVGDEVVINIQDAHNSIDAQKSIARIIKQLVGQYDIDLIGVEGSVGTIDPSIVSSFPIKSVREKTAEALLRDTRIGAAEFFKILSQDRVELFGVEEDALYESNVKAYQQLLSEQNRIAANLSELSSVLKKLEKKIYSKEMLDFTRSRVLHENGDIQFSEYWKVLKPILAKTGVRLDDLQSLSNLIRAIEIEEDLDFDLATSQRNKLMNELRTRLKGEDLKRMVVRSVQFKTGRLTPGRFHTELAKAAQESGVDPASFGELIKFSQYAVLYESIDILDVLAETTEFENRIRILLTPSTEARRLDQMSRVIDVLAKLLSSKLTTTHRKFFEVNRAKFEITAIKSFFHDMEAKTGVSVNRVDFGYLMQQIPVADEFYRLAEDRNQAMLDRLIQRMRNRGTQVAALVTGGYHAEGLSNIMNSDQVTHLVYLPKFTDKEGQRPYATIITRKGSFLDEKIRYEAQLETAAIVISTAMQGGMKFYEARKVYMDNYLRSLVSRGIDPGFDPREPNALEGVIREADGALQVAVNFDEEGVSSVRSKQVPLSFYLRRREIEKHAEAVRKGSAVLISTDLSSPIINSDANRINVESILREAKNNFMKRVLSSKGVNRLDVSWNKEWKAEVDRVLRKKGMNLNSLNNIDKEHFDKQFLELEERIGLEVSHLQGSALKDMSMDAQSSGVSPRSSMMGSKEMASRLAKAVSGVVLGESDHREGGEGPIYLAFPTKQSTLSTGRTTEVTTELSSASRLAEEHKVGELVVDAAKKTEPEVDEVTDKGSRMAGPFDVVGKDFDVIGPGLSHVASGPPQGMHDFERIGAASQNQTPQRPKRAWWSIGLQHMGGAISVGVFTAVTSKVLLLILITKLAAIPIAVLFAFGVIIYALNKLSWALGKEVPIKGSKDVDAPKVYRQNIFGAKKFAIGTELQGPVMPFLLLSIAPLLGKFGRRMIVVRMLQYTGVDLMTLEGNKYRYKNDKEINQAFMETMGEDLKSNNPEVRTNALLIRLLEMIWQNRKNRILKNHKATHPDSQLPKDASVGAIILEKAANAMGVKAWPELFKKMHEVDGNKAAAFLIIPVRYVGAAITGVVKILMAGYHILKSFIFWTLDATIGYHVSGDSRKSFFNKGEAVAIFKAGMERHRSIRFDIQKDMDPILDATGLKEEDGIRSTIIDAKASLEVLQKEYKRKLWELPGLTDSASINQGIVRYVLFNLPFGFWNKERSDGLLKARADALKAYEEAMLNVDRAVQSERLSSSKADALADADDGVDIAVQTLRRQGRFVISGSSPWERLKETPLLAPIFGVATFAGDFSFITAAILFFQKRGPLLVAGGITTLLVAKLIAVYWPVVAVIFLALSVKLILQTHQAYKVYKAQIKLIEEDGEIDPEDKRKLKRKLGLFFAGNVIVSVGLMALMWTGFHASFDANGVFNLFNAYSGLNFYIGEHMVDLSAGAWITAFSTSFFLAAQKDVNAEKDRLLTNAFNQDLTNNNVDLKIKGVTYAAIRNFLFQVQNNTGADPLKPRSYDPMVVTTSLLRKYLLLGFFKLSATERQAVLMQIDQIESGIPEEYQDVLIQSRGLTEALPDLFANTELDEDGSPKTTVSPTVASRNKFISQVYQHAMTGTMTSNKFWASVLIRTWAMRLVTDEVAGVVAVSEEFGDMVENEAVATWTEGVSEDHPWVESAYNATTELLGVLPIIVTTIEGTHNASDSMGDQLGLLGSANFMIGVGKDKVLNVVDGMISKGSRELENQIIALQNEVKEKNVNVKKALKAYFEADRELKLAQLTYGPDSKQALVAQAKAAKLKEDLTKSHKELDQAREQLAAAEVSAISRKRSINLLAHIGGSEIFHKPIATLTETESEIRRLALQFERGEAALEETMQHIEKLLPKVVAKNVADFEEALNDGKGVKELVHKWTVLEHYMYLHPDLFEENEILKLWNIAEAVLTSTSDANEGSGPGPDSDKVQIALSAVSAIIASNVVTGIIGTGEEVSSGLTVADIDRIGTVVANFDKGKKIEKIISIITAQINEASSQIKADGVMQKGEAIYAELSNEVMQQMSSWEDRHRFVSVQGKVMQWTSQEKTRQIDSIEDAGDSKTEVSRQFDRAIVQTLIYMANNINLSTETLEENLTVMLGQWRLSPSDQTIERNPRILEVGGEGINKVPINKLDLSGIKTTSDKSQRDLEDAKAVDEEHAEVGEKIEPDEEVVADQLIARDPENTKETKIDQKEVVEEKAEVFFSPVINDVGKVSSKGQRTPTGDGLLGADIGSGPGAGSPPPPDEVVVDNAAMDKVRTIIINTDLPTKIIIRKGDAYTPKPDASGLPEIRTALELLLDRPNLFFDEELMSTTNDQKTHEAIKEYQAKRGLQDDGSYGPKTRQAMVDDLEKLILPERLSKSRGVYSFATDQAALLVRTALEILLDRPDLFSDEELSSTANDQKTQDAVKEFQKKHGLKDDGIYGPKTRRAMLSELQKYREENPKTPIISDSVVNDKTSPDVIDDSIESSDDVIRGVVINEEVLPDGDGDADLSISKDMQNSRGDPSEENLERTSGGTRGVDESDDVASSLPVSSNTPKVVSGTASADADSIAVAASATLPKNTSSADDVQPNVPTANKEKVIRHWSDAPVPATRLVPEPGQALPAKDLPKSFESAEQEESVDRVDNRTYGFKLLGRIQSTLIPSNWNTPGNSTNADTADQATAIIAMIHNEEMGSALHLLNFYIQRFIEKSNEVPSGLPTVLKHRNPDRGPIVYGQNTESTAWMAIASLHYYEATRDENALSFAVKVADWAIKLEHNPVSAALFDMLSKMPKAGLHKDLEKFESAARRIETSMAHDFETNREEELTSEASAVLSLGAEKLHRLGIEVESLVERIEAKFGVQENGEFGGEFEKLVGFNFSGSQNDKRADGGSGAIEVASTFQMVLAYQDLASYYEDSDAAKSEKYQKRADHFIEAMEERKMPNGTFGETVPSESVIPTSKRSLQASEGGISTSSMMWYYFAAKDIYPFKLIEDEFPNDGESSSKPLSAPLKSENDGDATSDLSETSSEVTGGGIYTNKTDERSYRVRKNHGLLTPREAFNDPTYITGSPPQPREWRKVADLSHVGIYGPIAYASPGYDDWGRYVKHQTTVYSVPESNFPPKLIDGDPSLNSRVYTSRPDPRPLGYDPSSILHKIPFRSPVLEKKDGAASLPPPPMLRDPLTVAKNARVDEETYQELQEASKNPLKVRQREDFLTKVRGLSVPERMEMLEEYSTSLTTAWNDEDTTDPSKTSSEGTGPKGGGIFSDPPIMFTSSPKGKSPGQNWVWSKEKGLWYYAPPTPINMTMVPGVGLVPITDDRKRTPLISPLGPVFSIPGRDGKVVLQPIAESEHRPWMSKPNVEYIVAPDPKPFGYDPASIIQVPFRVETLEKKRGAASLPPPPSLRDPLRITQTNQENEDTYNELLGVLRKSKDKESPVDNSSPQIISSLISPIFRPTWYDYPGLSMAPSNHEVRDTSEASSAKNDEDDKAPSETSSETGADSQNKSESSSEGTGGGGGLFDGPKPLFIRRGEQPRGGTRWRWDDREKMWLDLSKGGPGNGGPLPIEPPFISSLGPGFSTDGRQGNSVIRPIAESEYKLWIHGKKDASDPIQYVIAPDPKPFGYDPGSIIKVPFRVEALEKKYGPALLPPPPWLRDPLTIAKNKERDTETYGELVEASQKPSKESIADNFSSGSIDLDLLGFSPTWFDYQGLADASDPSESSSEATGDEGLFGRTPGLFQRPKSPPDFSGKWFWSQSEYEWQIPVGHQWSHPGWIPPGYETAPPRKEPYISPFGPIFSIPGRQGLSIIQPIAESEFKSRIHGTKTARDPIQYVIAPDPAPLGYDPEWIIKVPFRVEALEKKYGPALRPSPPSLRDPLMIAQTNQENEEAYNKLRGVVKDSSEERLADNSSPEVSSLSFSAFRPTWFEYQGLTSVSNPFQTSSEITGPGNISVEDLDKIPPGGNPVPQYGQVGEGRVGGLPVAPENPKYRKFVEPYISPFGAAFSISGYFTPGMDGSGNYISYRTQVVPIDSRTFPKPISTNKVLYVEVPPGPLDPYGNGVSVPFHPITMSPQPQAATPPSPPRDPDEIVQDAKTYSEDVYRDDYLAKVSRFDIAQIAEEWTKYSRLITKGTGMGVLVEPRKHPVDPKNPSDTALNKLAYEHPNSQFLFVDEYRRVPLEFDGAAPSGEMGGIFINLETKQKIKLTTRGLKDWLKRNEHHSDYEDVEKVFKELQGVEAIIRHRLEILRAFYPAVVQDITDSVIGGREKKLAQGSGSDLVAQYPVERQRYLDNLMSQAREIHPFRYRGYPDSFSIMYAGDVSVWQNRRGILPKGGISDLTQAQLMDLMPDEFIGYHAHENRNVNEWTIKDEFLQGKRPDHHRLDGTFEKAELMQLMAQTYSSGLYISFSQDHINAASELTKKYFKPNKVYYIQNNGDRVVEVNEYKRHTSEPTLSYALTAQILDGSIPSSPYAQYPSFVWGPRQMLPDYFMRLMVDNGEKSSFIFLPNGEVMVIPLVADSDEEGTPEQANIIHLDGTAEQVVSVASHNLPLANNSMSEVGNFSWSPERSMFDDLRVDSSSGEEWLNKLRREQELRKIRKSEPDHGPRIVYDDQGRQHDLSSLTESELQEFLSRHQMRGGPKPPKVEPGVWIQIPSSEDQSLASDESKDSKEDQSSTTQEGDDSEEQPNTDAHTITVRNFNWTIPGLDGEDSKYKKSKLFRRVPTFTEPNGGLIQRKGGSLVPSPFQRVSARDTEDGGHGDSEQIGIEAVIAAKEKIKEKPQSMAFRQQAGMRDPQWLMDKVKADADAGVATEVIKGRTMDTPVGKKYFEDREAATTILVRGEEDTKHWLQRMREFLASVSRTKTPDYEPDHDLASQILSGEIPDHVIWTMAEELYDHQEGTKSIFTPGPEPEEAEPVFLPKTVPFERGREVYTDSGNMGVRILEGDTRVYDPPTVLEWVGEYSILGKDENRQPRVDANGFTWTIRWSSDKHYSLLIKDQFEEFQHEITGDIEIGMMDPDSGKMVNKKISQVIREWFDRKDLSLPILSPDHEITVNGGVITVAVSNEGFIEGTTERKGYGHTGNVVLPMKALPFTMGELLVWSDALNRGNASTVTINGGLINGEEPVRQEVYRRPSSIEDAEIWRVTDIITYRNQYDSSEAVDADGNIVSSLARRYESSSAIYTAELDSEGEYVTSATVTHKAGSSRSITTQHEFFEPIPLSRLTQNGRLKPELLTGAQVSRPESFGRKIGFTASHELIDSSTPDQVRDVPRLKVSRVVTPERHGENGGFAIRYHKDAVGFVLDEFDDEKTVAALYEAMMASFKTNQEPVYGRGKQLEAINKMLSDPDLMDKFKDEDTKIQAPEFFMRKGVRDGIKKSDNPGYVRMWNKRLVGRAFPDVSPASSGQIDPNEAYLNYDLKPLTAEENEILDNYLRTGDPGKDNIGFDLAEKVDGKQEWVWTDPNGNVVGRVVIDMRANTTEISYIERHTSKDSVDVKVERVFRVPANRDGLFLNTNGRLKFYLSSYGNTTPTPYQILEKVGGQASLQREVYTTGYDKRGNPIQTINIHHNEPVILDKQDRFSEPMEAKMVTTRNVIVGDGYRMTWYVTDKGEGILEISRQVNESGKVKTVVMGYENAESDPANWVFSQLTPIGFSESASMDDVSEANPFLKRSLFTRAVTHVTEPSEYSANRPEVESYSKKGQRVDLSRIDKLINEGAQESDSRWSAFFENFKGLENFAPDGHTHSLGVGNLVQVNSLAQSGSTLFEPPNEDTSTQQHIYTDSYGRKMGTEDIHNGMTKRLSVVDSIQPDGTYTIYSLTPTWIQEPDGSFVLIRRSDDEKVESSQIMIEITRARERVGVMGPGGVLGEYYGTYEYTQLDAYGFPIEKGLVENYAELSAAPPKNYEALSIPRKKSDKYKHVTPSSQEVSIFRMGHRTQTYGLLNFADPSQKDGVHTFVGSVTNSAGSIDEIGGIPIPSGGVKSMTTHYRHTEDGLFYVTEVDGKTRTLIPTTDSQNRMIHPGWAEKGVWMVEDPYSGLIEANAYDEKLADIDLSEHEFISQKEERIHDSSTEDLVASIRGEHLIVVDRDPVTRIEIGTTEYGWDRINRVILRDNTPEQNKVVNSVRRNVNAFTEPSRPDGAGRDVVEVIAVITPYDVTPVLDDEGKVVEYIRVPSRDSNGERVRIPSTEHYVNGEKIYERLNGSEQLTQSDGGVDHYVLQEVEDGNPIRRLNGKSVFKYTKNGVNIDSTRQHYSSNMPVIPAPGGDYLATNTSTIRQRDSYAETIDEEMNSIIRVTQDPVTGAPIAVQDPGIEGLQDLTNHDHFSMVKKVDGRVVEVGVMDRDQPYLDDGVENWKVWKLQYNPETRDLLVVIPSQVTRWPQGDKRTSITGGKETIYKAPWADDRTTHLEEPREFAPRGIEANEFVRSVSIDPKIGNVTTVIVDRDDQVNMVRVTNKHGYLLWETDSEKAVEFDPEFERNNGFIKPTRRYQVMVDAATGLPIADINTPMADIDMKLDLSDLKLPMVIYADAQIEGSDIRVGTREFPRFVETRSLVHDNGLISRERAWIDPDGIRYKAVEKFKVAEAFDKGYEIKDETRFFVDRQRDVEGKVRELSESFSEESREWVTVYDEKQFQHTNLPANTTLQKIVDRDPATLGIPPHVMDTLDEKLQEGGADLSGEPIRLYVAEHINVETGSARIILRQQSTDDLVISWMSTGDADIKLGEIFNAPEESIAVKSARGFGDSATLSKVGVSVIAVIVAIPVILVIGGSLVYWLVKRVFSGGKSKRLKSKTTDDSIETSHEVSKDAARLAESDIADGYVKHVYIVDSLVREHAENILAITNPGVVVTDQRTLEDGTIIVEELKVDAASISDIRVAVLTYAKDLQVRNRKAINVAFDRGEWSSMLEFAFAGMAALGKYNLDVIREFKSQPWSGDAESSKSLKSLAMGIDADLLNVGQVTTLIDHKAALRLQTWLAYSSTQPTMKEVVRHVIDLRGAKPDQRDALLALAETHGIEVVKRGDKFGLEEGEYIPVTTQKRDGVHVYVPEEVEEAGHLELAALRAKSEEEMQELKALGKLMTKALQAVIRSFLEVGHSA